MTTKTLRTLPAATIALGIILSACSNNSSYDDTTISFALMTQSRAYTLQGSAADYQADKDLTYLDSASLLIPTVIGTHDVRTLQDSIFSVAFDTTGIDHRQLAERYFENIAAENGYKTEIADGISINNCDGFDVVSGAVSTLTPDMLVYCVTVENYSPRAAHGITTKRYINYAIADGKVITLNDIFTAQGLQSLPEAIAKRANDLVSVFGPTEVTALPSGNNFYISAAGEIVFVYQQYEIASFAQGIISIPFYSYELCNYMTPAGLHLFGIQHLSTDSEE